MLMEIAPNLRAHTGYCVSPEYDWTHRYRFVVLKKYVNGWHCGVTNSPIGKEDYYIFSGVSEEMARNIFVRLTEGNS